MITYEDLLHVELLGSYNLRRAYANTLPLEDPQRKLIHAQLDEIVLRKYGYEWSELFDLAKELIEEFGEILIPSKVKDLSPRFCGGLVESITVDAETFLKEALDFYAVAPIRQIEITNAKPYISQIFSSPHIDRMIFIDLEINDLTDDDMKYIANSCHLENLKSLNLNYNKITTRGYEILASSEMIPSVEILTLCGNKNAAPQVRMTTDAMYSVVLGEGIPTGQTKRLEVMGPYAKKWLYAPEKWGNNYPPSAEEL